MEGIGITLKLITSNSRSQTINFTGAAVSLLTSQVNYSLHQRVDNGAWGLPSGFQNSENL